METSPLAASDGAGYSWADDGSRINDTENRGDQKNVKEENKKHCGVDGKDRILLEFRSEFQFGKLTNPKSGSEDAGNLETPGKHAETANFADGKKRARNWNVI